MNKLCEKYTFRYTQIFGTELNQKYEERKTYLYKFILYMYIYKLIYTLLDKNTHKATFQNRGFF